MLQRGQGKPGHLKKKKGLQSKRTWSLTRKRKSRDNKLGRMQKKTVKGKRMQDDVSTRKLRLSCLRLNEGEASEKPSEKGTSFAVS